MTDQVERLAQLNAWLDTGRISHSEYEKLKASLLGSSSHDPSSPGWDLQTLLAAELQRLEDENYASLGIQKETLPEADRSGFNFLSGVEAFLSDVREQSRLAIAPETDLGGLARSEPKYLSMAIYMGVIRSIEAMTSDSASPIEARMLIASFADCAWENMVEKEVSFDPGPDWDPAGVFARLGVTTEILDPKVSNPPSRIDGGPLTVGFLVDDVSEEDMAAVWDKVGRHEFSVSKADEGGYRWERGTLDGDDYVVVATGLERSESIAEEMLDSQITDLAIECVRARDSAVTFAESKGYVPRLHYPRFQWGPIDKLTPAWDWINVGVWAKFGDSDLPLARVRDYEIARKLILAIAVVSGDQQMVAELMAAEADRQLFNSLMAAGNKERRRSKWPWG